MTIHPYRGYSLTPGRKEYLNHTDCRESLCRSGILPQGKITSSHGTVYQASNNNVSCFYYNGAGELLNVSDNSLANTNDALNVLDGGTDANFFELDNGTITVIE